jgi:hypothetical protein
VPGQLCKWGGWWEKIFPMSNKFLPAVLFIVAQHSDYTSWKRSNKILSASDCFNIPV